MKKVLIADDDVLVCRFLSQLIDWQAYGYELIGTARDGSQALNLIREKNPDILITDIEMPVMNGIGLLKEIRRSGNRMKILMLSCHDDFAYVKEAMRSGADEYFLKDELTREKLLEILAQLSGDMDDTSVDSEEIQHALQREMEEKQLQQLLEGTLGQIDGFHPEYVLAVHVTDYENQAFSRTTERRTEFYQNFADSLRDQIPAQMAGRVCHVRAGWFALLVEVRGQKRETDFQYLMMELGNGVRHMADKHFGVTVQIGIGKIDREVSAGWGQAKELLGYAFYKNGSIFCGWQEVAMGNSMPSAARDFLENADGWKARRDTDRIRAAATAALKAFQTEYTQESLVAFWLRSADRIFGIDPRPLPAKFETLKDLGREYVKAFQDRTSDIRQYSDSIAAVIRFIRDNYQNNISLNAVADAVHLTPTYLSYIFHKETNITFSDYLATYRINRAKELLESTDEKIREIGFLVGYNDHRHFCKTFKKMLGVTPQEYRKQNRK